MPGVEKKKTGRGPGNAAGRMACNICKHHPLEADGSCGKCGADPETAWTPPVGYAPPLTEKELRTKRGVGMDFTDEEVWNLRRKFRASPLNMHAFLKQEKIGKHRGASALRGTGRYEGV